MDGGLHPKVGIARLYLRWKKSERVLTSLEDCVELTRADIDSFISNREECLLKAPTIVARDGELKRPNELKNQKRKRIKIIWLAVEGFAG